MNNNEIPSRVKRNASLYTRMSEEEIDSFNVSSNATVLDGNTNTIDVDKLRDMLDKKYRDNKKSVSLKKDDLNDISHEVNLDETREYNINDILNKVKEDKNRDYEKERFRKLKANNIEIINEYDNKSSKTTNDKDKLIELIDTINLKETEGYNKILEDEDEMDPLEILSDLKGDNDETKVMGAKDLDDTDEISYTEVDVFEDDLENDEYDEDLDEEDDTAEIKWGFNQDLTQEQLFKESDFEDFDDLSNSSKTNFFIKLLIFIVIIAVLCGGVFLANRIFDLGWF